MKRTVKNPVERRAEIIEAARYLFQEQDYEKTTMQDVMKRLDIAKGTIYHYFPSKEALLEAVVEDIAESAVERIKARMPKKKGNVLTQMQVLIKNSNVTGTDKGVLEHLHKSGNEVLHTRLLAVMVKKLAPLYALLIELGCKEGIFEVENPLECAEFILAGVQFLVDKGIYDWRQEDLNRRAQALPHLIEQLLKAKSDSFRFLVKDFNV